MHGVMLVEYVIQHFPELEMGRNIFFRLFRKICIFANHESFFFFVMLQRYAKTNFDCPNSNSNSPFVKANKTLQMNVKLVPCNFFREVNYPNQITKFLSSQKIILSH